MEFGVYSKGFFPKNRKNLFCLYQDKWDDFGYKTTFHAYYYDNFGIQKELSSVQVGFAGMEEGAVINSLPHTFSTLSETFFSLGTSEEYYIKIASLGPTMSEKIFAAMNDMAYNLQIFNKYEDEPVVQTSFLRDRSAFTVRQQLSRIARGGARLDKYNFKYTAPSPKSEQQFPSISLEFSVIPFSNPPTNIHVLIGRNGSGKTMLIKNMVRALQSGNSEFGNFENLDNPFTSELNLFANVLCVAFSPFDDFSAISSVSESALPFSFIGLDKERPNLLFTIQEQFIQSFEACMNSRSKKLRWSKTIEILNSDPVFEESQISQFVSEWDQSDSEKQPARDFIKKTFSSLSSGHKVTLLIITSCVDKLEEKSIAFLDEPENHLHPPLLSAFIRALSYLLTDRNGVAIISTHSPVVLQEVPSMCVWILQRTNALLKAERLDVETFGSSISLLTTEVFGLEVTDSGFHKMLREAVNNNKNFQDIVDQFNGQLGNEALAIIRALLAVREERGRTI
ncbi:AAA family ATPase [Allofournierella sp.]|uniref:AAA family ATPase n=1 Tax=Allofournierella sp. TaxID=1940256 RepID=UPI003AB8991C